MLRNRVGEQSRHYGNQFPLCCGITEILSDVQGCIVAGIILVLPHFLAISGQ